MIFWIGTRCSSGSPTSQTRASRRSVLACLAGAFHRRCTSWMQWMSKVCGLQPEKKENHVELSAQKVLEGVLAALPGGRGGPKIGNHLIGKKQVQGSCIQLSQGI